MGTVNDNSREEEGNASRAPPMATATLARARKRKKEKRKSMKRPDFVKNNGSEAGNARSGKD